MNDDHVDQLLDSLLREELGAQNPPDLLPRILAEAEGRRSVVRPGLKWARRLAAAAAVVTIVALAYMLSASGRHPGPELDLLAGRRIETGASAEQVELDGYCQLTVEPGSGLTISGAPLARRVALDYGSLRCAVREKSGTFHVDTCVGVLTVQGTEFGVRLSGGKGDEEMASKQLFVRVVTGAVALATAWGGNVTLGAEGKDGKEEKIEGGTLTGYFMERREGAAFIRVDGEKEKRRFQVISELDNDVELVKRVERLGPCTRVRGVWMKIDGAEQLLGLEVEEIAQKGSLTGKVLSRDWLLEIKPERGPVELFRPAWGERDGDRDVLHKIKSCERGDIVTVEWFNLNNAKCVSDVQRLKRADDGEGHAHKDKEGERKREWVGEVVRTRGERIIFKAEGVEYKLQLPEKWAELAKRNPEKLEQWRANSVKLRVVGVETREGDAAVIVVEHLERAEKEDREPERHRDREKERDKGRDRPQNREH